MICADFEREDVLCDRQGWESSDDYSEITEYVRADIAAAREAAAYERAWEEREEDRREMEGERRAHESVGLVTDGGFFIADEPLDVDALVAERDALRAKVKEQEDVARIFREMADEQVDRAVAERDALRAALAERGESDFCRQAVAERVLLKGALEKVVGFLGTEWLPWKARTAALDALEALSGKGVG